MGAGASAVEQPFESAEAALAAGKTQEEIDEWMTKHENAGPADAATSSKSSGKEEGEIRLVTPRLDPPISETAEATSAASSKSSGKEDGEIRLVTPRVDPPISEAVEASAGAPAEATLVADMVWQSLYGLLGMFSTADAAETSAFLTKEGQEQMADANEKAPMWTVLGQSTSNAEKVCWVAYFDDKDAYNVTHKAAQEPGKGRAVFVDEIMKHAANVDGGYPANMAGFTFGDIQHLENPATLATGFAVVVSRKLADADAAAGFVESEKSHWAGLMNGAAKDSLCRVTLFGPGADVPLPWVPAEEVRTLHQWVSKEAYDSAQDSIRGGDETADWFGGPQHFTKTNRE